MKPANGVRMLVEGPDDKWSLISLLKRDLADRGQSWDELAWRPDVQDQGGLQGVLDILEVSAKSYPRLGVVVDADEELAARWMAVRDRLRRAGVQVPDKPVPDGFVGPGLLPDSKVGVWLMPDNQLPGTLEDLLAVLVPPEDPCWDLAGASVQAAVSRTKSARNPAWHSKARIHTWLAWQDRPGQPLGQAITASVLREVAHPGAAAFVQWFERVFAA